MSAFFRKYNEKMAKRQLDKKYDSNGLLIGYSSKTIIGKLAVGKKMYDGELPPWQTELKQDKLF